MNELTPRERKIAIARGEIPIIETPTLQIGSDSICPHGLTEPCHICGNDTKTLVERLLDDEQVGDVAIHQAADRLISLSERNQELEREIISLRARLQELESQGSISSRKIYE